LIKIIHTADLHLSNSENKEYSLNVLDEIIEYALEIKPDYIIFAGDTFDSFSDAEKLRHEFRKRIEKLKDISEIFMLAGNHEALRNNGGKLKSFDFGIKSDNIIEFGDENFKLFKRENVEFIAIPHQPDYSDYPKWEVPVKESKIRIAIAHAIIAGFSYTGPDDEGEEKAAIMDATIFSSMDVDYAAMGHIHSRRENKNDKRIINYPGSARVWRKGEDGARFISFVKINDSVEVKSLELKSAGEYRKYNLFISFDGEFEDMSDTISLWRENDFIDISFSGIVEDENILSENIKKFEEDFSSQVRILNIEKNVSVLSGIASQPIAKKYLEIWKSKEPDKKDEESFLIWQKSRESGLLKIKKYLEVRQ
jgi:DNA repair exonuclease SbcCD nuclease subunit